MATRYPSVPGVRFKDIENFPGYCVGDDGSVWSNRRPGKNGEWSKLRLIPQRDGNLHVGLHGKGKGKHKQASVHVLVLEAFVGPRPPGMLGCHFPDRDPTNNRPENLMWGTPKENTGHMAIHGTKMQGETHHASKLKDDDIREIRRAFALQADKTDKNTLAQRFGVSKSLIRFIVIGAIWRHVHD